MAIMSDHRAVPIFIFVTRPRVGRFLAFHQEKKTKKCIHVLICSVKLEGKMSKKVVSCSFFLARHNSVDLRTHMTQFSRSEDHLKLLSSSGDLPAVKLGQCKARPFKFHRVCFLFISVLQHTNSYTFSTLMGKLLDLGS